MTATAQLFDVVQLDSQHQGDGTASRVPLAAYAWDKTEFAGWRPMYDETGCFRTPICLAQDA